MSKKVTEEEKGISPEDIRAIRENLGLSQAEAGDILGGGPRAFTKYESGTIKPAQSVVNLLRLLEAQPSALVALTGKRTVALSDAGQRPFEVTGKHVEALSPRMLSVLVRKLLSAEAQAADVPPDGVHVAGSITTPDAGEDGRIEWSEGVDRTAYLPGRLTQVQLKAGKLSPGEAAAEVLDRKGAVKKMVADVLAKGGFYVLICAQAYVKKDIQERERRILEALRNAGLAIDDDQVSFRDADQLAAWINTHPAVATWLLEHTQPGLTGPFRTWGNWRGRAEHDGSAWVDDTRLEDVRNQVRAAASAPRTSLRVVGASGIGKSRLVLEALGPTDAEADSGHAAADAVLYADEAQVGSVAILTAAEHLALSGYRAVLVIDRCAPSTHADLENQIKRKGSELSLVTIDDDVPEDPLPPGLFRLSEAPGEVVEGIINNVAPGLPSEDQRRLVRFSRGFPKVANLVARAWAQEVPIARATDETLVDSVLFGRGGQGSEKLRRVAELIGAFGRIRMNEGKGAELPDLLSLSTGLDKADVRQGVEDFARRGIIQRKGRFAVLQPRPIALRLAERQWRHWGPDTWDRVLAGDLPSELRVRAAWQLALLNTTSTGREVVAHVCRYGGPLASPEGVTTPGNAEVLSALAEVDGELVAQLLESALEGVDPGILLGDTRRHLVWGLQKIAFSPDTFEEGARLLLRLAVAENESFSNNATGQFTGLFPVLLAETAADPAQRLAFLDEVAKTHDPKERELVVQALLAGAKTSHFTRAVGAETHGSRPALEPWQPKTWDEAWDYVRACLERLTVFALGSDPASEAARQGMAHEFRGMVARGLIDEVETAITRVREKHEYWPQALDALGDVIQYDTKGVPPETVERVRNMIGALEPRGWTDRVQFFVTELPWDWPAEEGEVDFDERGRKQVEAVRELAREILREPDNLRPLLKSMSRGNQRMATVFGEAIADLADEPLLWLEPLKSALEETDPNERNFALLAGYLSGLAHAHPQEVQGFKAAAAKSAVFAPALPLICWRLGIQAADIALVSSALSEGLLPVHTLMQWTLGGVLAELQPSEVSPLFDLLFGMDAGSISVGIDVLGMYVHGHKERLEELRPQLRQLAEVMTRKSRSRASQMDVHHLKGLLGWLLAKGRDDPDATVVALTLAKAAVATEDYERSELLEPLMPQLLSGFPEVVWPLLGQAIVSGGLKAWRMQHLLGDSFAFDNKSNPALLQLPEETLMAWCYANPDAAPAFVAGIVPVLSEPDEQGDRALTPLMRRIIDEFGDREGVLDALNRNMHTFGWSGSRANYFALYEKPLSALLTHPAAKVRRWAKRVLRSLSAQIDDARAEDAEQEAEWD